MVKVAFQIPTCLFILHWVITGLVPLDATGATALLQSSNDNGQLLNNISTIRD